jgi:hypothetical protein
MKDTKKKKKYRKEKEDNDKDGHSQILCRDKKREICVHVFIMSNKKEEVEFTHITRTQAKKKKNRSCASSFCVF